MRFAIMFCLLLAATACGRGVPNEARIVVAGDSVMAWNRIEGRSVGQEVSRLLGMPVGDVSLPFASVMSRRGALNIPAQLDGVDADWVVMNGGANDLGVGCSGADTGAILDRLVSADGQSGAIPALVDGLRGRGARVLWADYYTSPKFTGTACSTFYEEMARRTRAMAAADDGIAYVDMGDTMPVTDLTLFAPDRVHPSEAGSARIARLVTGAMRDADPRLAR